MAIDLPKGALASLKTAWRERRLVPFLGAGISAPYGLPQWTDLVMRILIDESWQEFDDYWKNYQTPLAVWMTENFDFGLESLARFAKSSYAVNTGDRRRQSFNDYVGRQLYEKVPPQPPLARATTLTAVADLIQVSEQLAGGRAVPAVVTLNFDDLLERELETREIGVEAVFDGRRRHASRLPVVHAHGFLPRGQRAPPSDLIFTEDDYNRFALQTIHWAQVDLLGFLRNSTALFIGMSMADTNLRRLLDATSNGRCNHYVVRKRFTLSSGERTVAARRIHQRAMTGLKPAERKKMQRHAQGLEGAIERMLRMAANIDTQLLREMGVSTIWIDDFSEIADLLTRIPTRA